MTARVTSLASDSLGAIHTAGRQGARCGDAFNRSSVVTYSAVARVSRSASTGPPRLDVGFATPILDALLHLSHLAAWGRKLPPLGIGHLVTDDSIREAVTQVRGYCDDAGIRHAIATNGYAWIVFRAIRDDMPWREGRARVFPTLEAIIERFTEFWNLLSYDAVLAGSLEEEFGVPRRPASRTLSGRRLWGGVRNSFPLGPIDHECPLRRCGVRLRRREGLTRRLDQGTVPETRQPSSRQSHRGWPDRSSAECRFPPAQQPPLPPYPWAGEPAAAHR